MKKSSRKTTDPTLIIQKKLANPIITFLSDTPITANQVTICNFLIFAPLSAYFFFRGGFSNNILAPRDIFFLSLFTHRRYMLVGIFLNILEYTFILFGIAIIVRSLSMYLILSFHYAKPALSKKYATFSYLDHFQK